MSEKKLEENISYIFKNSDLLKLALTHKSCYRDKPDSIQKHNERLEFLGDAMLDAIISEEIYTKLPSKNEGNLTKIRASIVCEKSLANIARNINLGQHIYLSKGEDSSDGRKKMSILADTLEALIGAIYLDSGYENLKRLVLVIFDTKIKEAMAGKLYDDYKTQLQEFVQATESKPAIKYIHDKEEGPAHDRTFFVMLSCGGHIVARGEARSKKEAEQTAAREALKKLKEIIV